MSTRDKVTPIRRSPTTDLALIHEAIERLERKLDLSIELMCPQCGPAAVVRMHPELGPQPLRPVAEGHKHD